MQYIRFWANFAHSLKNDPHAQLIYPNLCLSFADPESLRTKPLRKWPLRRTGFQLCGYDRKYRIRTGAPQLELAELFCQFGALPPYNNFQDLLCDIYEPCGDAETERPLLVVIHGGAWAGGNKRDMAPYCHQMALRGYVVVSISYRLSITPNLLCWNAELDENKFFRAFYRAMQDAKAAVRYFPGQCCAMAH